MTWKRVLGWSMAAIVALALLVVIGGLSFLKTNLFHQYAARKISQEAQKATGAAVQIRWLEISLSTLTAHVYGITLHGTEPAGQPPLLQAGELTVSISIHWILHPRIGLQELLIQRPVIHLQVDGSGHTNLPQPPPSQGGSQTNVFDLAVGHVQLTDGEVYYNDRKIPLQADLYNLGTDIHFDSWAKRYRGTLSYSSGHLQYANYSSLPHELSLKFSATPDRFTLEPLVLKVGGSQIALQAGISGYASPVADGSYEIRVNTHDFAAMSPSVTPSGDVVLQGKVHYESVENEPFLQAVSISGNLSGQGLTAKDAAARLVVNRMRGRYRLHKGQLDVTNLTIETLGGTIAAGARVQHLDTTPLAQVRASLKDISLRAAHQALRQPSWNAATLSGVLNGTVQASWKGSVSNAQARADLAVRAEAGSRSNPGAGDIPVNAVIHGTYDGLGQRLTLNDTVVNLPAARLTAQGVVSNQSNLQLQLSVTELHQLIAIASSFGATTGPPPAVSGSAMVSASVHGAIRKPQVSAQVSATNLKVEGSEWKTASFGVQATPAQITISNGTLISAKQGQARLDGTVGLQNWTYVASSPVRMNLTVQRMQLSDLERLAREQYPITGELSANVSFKGSQLDPAGSGSARVAKARLYGEPVQNLALKFDAANGSIHSTLDMSAPAGAIAAEISFTPKTKAYRVRLDAPSVVLEKLRTLQEKNVAAAGTVQVSASGEGTLDDPQLAATLQVPQLSFRQGSIGQLKAQVQVANRRAEFTLDSNVGKASVRGHGRVNLVGDYDVDAAIDSGTISLDWLMAAYAHAAPEGFRGQTEIHATIKGPLRNKARLEAHVSMPTLQASYQSLEIGLANPIRADYANSIVTLQPVEIRGTGTSLHLQGRVPLGEGGSPEFTAQGSVDARIFRILQSDARSSGTFAIDVRTSGTASNPALEGQVRIQNVSFTTEQSPMGIDKLNGTLNIGNNRIQISNATAQMGGGQVSLGGSVAYRPSLQFNLAVQGQSIRLRYPEGLRTLLDANVALTGTLAESSLNGRVLIDSLSFEPDFDLSKFADQFSTGTSVPSQPGFADTVRLALSVQSKESLSAISSQVSIGGAANLQVIGTVANPVIIGRVNLNSGELFYRNARYELKPGLITFDDPVQTHPVMNVSVGTTVEQYNLTLTLRGPLDNLSTAYVADPPLATADIINLIARGKTTQEAEASSTSTDSIVASGAASQLSSSVQKLAGISSLQIDPLIGGNNQNPSARIAIQQRVSKNLLFTFSTDVTQPGSEIVQGEYQINQHWSASVARDQLGGVSVDGKYHKRF